MKAELIDYIIIHYTHLFSINETAAYKHYHTLQKNEDAEPRIKNFMLKHWGTKDEYFSWL